MQKYGKSNTRNEFFLDYFWTGLVFSGMENVINKSFLSRLNRDTHWKEGGNDGAGTGQAVGAEASGWERDDGERGWRA